MPTNSVIQPPANYLSVDALAFVSIDRPGTAVSAATPFPITCTFAAFAVAPVSGTTMASGTSVALVPELSRPVLFVLTGSWSGSVTLQRSADEGAT